MTTSVRLKLLSSLSGTDRNSLFIWFGRIGVIVLMAIGFMQIIKMGILAAFAVHGFQHPSRGLPPSLDLRRARLRAACETNKDLVEAEITSVLGKERRQHIDLQADLVLDRKRKVAFCKVPKAASTSWVDLFLSLNEPEVGHFRQLLPQPTNKAEAMQIGKAVFSFVTVRHPFERIAATYRDKFLHSSQDEHFKQKPFYKLGQAILTEERYPGLIVPRGYEQIPMFQELVRHITHSDFNQHWLPISLTCLPCHVEYNVVADVSSLEADSQFILRRMRLSQQDEEKASHLKLSRDHVSNDDIFSARNLFSQISRKEVIKLGERYKVDLALFGFGLEPYLSYAQREEPEIIKRNRNFELF